MAIERFTKDHEWIRVDGGIATVGITDHAQSQLGDVVFVEVPEVGPQGRAGRGGGGGGERQGRERRVRAGVRRGGRGQRRSRRQPALVNEDAEGKAWFFKIRIANPAELDTLMDRAAYEAFVKESL